MFNVNQFKQRLKAEREEQKLKQEDFAKLTGIARASASYYENKNNASLPNAEILFNMANILNVSTDYLLGITDKKTPDIDERAICEKTGLSENALYFLTGNTKIVKNDRTATNNLYISSINLFLECYDPLYRLLNEFITYRLKVDENQFNQRLDKKYIEWKINQEFTKILNEVSQHKDFTIEYDSRLAFGNDGIIEEDENA